MIALHEKRPLGAAFGLEQIGAIQPMLQKPGP